MGTVKAVIGLLAIIVVFDSGFRIIPPEQTNYSFQDVGKRALVGGANPHETDQVLMDVIRKPQEHQIALAPEPITVQRIGTPGAPAVYLAADYSQCSDKFAGMFLYPAFHAFQWEPRDVGPWRLA